MQSKLQLYGDLWADLFPMNIFTLKDSTIQMSPSLPMNFDRRLIPEDKCENEFVHLNWCFKRYGVKETAPSQCSNFIVRFNECKIKRDTILYDRIRTWEMAKFQSLSPENKQLYTQGLKFKLERLRQEFESVPSLSTTEFLQKRLNHEEAETRWRLRYLQKLV